MLNFRLPRDHVLVLPHFDLGLVADAVKFRLILKWRTLVLVKHFPFGCDGSSEAGKTPYALFFGKRNGFLVSDGNEVLTFALEEEIVGRERTAGIVLRLLPCRLRFLRQNGAVVWGFADLGNAVLTVCCQR